MHLQVYAEVGKDKGMQAMQETRKWRPFKTLQNAMSAESDARGMAVRQHTSYIRQHASAYVSIRRHTSLQNAAACYERRSASDARGMAVTYADVC